MAMSHASRHCNKPSDLMIGSSQIGTFAGQLTGVLQGQNQKRVCGAGAWFELLLSLRDALTLRRTKGSSRVFLKERLSLSLSLSHFLLHASLSFFFSFSSFSRCYGNTSQRKEGKKRWVSSLSFSLPPPPCLRSLSTRLKINPKWK